MWPGFKSRRRRHMWVEFVVGSLLCSERFFSGYSRFPLSSKTNISKFQFDQESGRRRPTMWMYYLQIVIYLFIYLLFILKCVLRLSCVVHGPIYGCFMGFLCKRFSLYYPGYQRFFSRAAGIFGVGRRPTRLRT